jgi:hypothetical protein
MKQKRISCTLSNIAMALKETVSMSTVSMSWKTGGLDLTIHETLSFKRRFLQPWIMTGENVS